MNHPIPEGTRPPFHPRDLRRRCSHCGYPALEEIVDGRGVVVAWACVDHTEQVLAALAQR